MARRCVVSFALAFTGSLVPVLPVASASATGVTLATGVVRDPSGAALAGARVMLVAWPSEATLDGLSPGRTLPLTTLDDAITDAGGRYSLTVASGSALTPFAGSDGIVD